MKAVRHAEGVLGKEALLLRGDLSILLVRFVCIRVAGGAGSGGGSRPEFEKAWVLLEGQLGRGDGSGWGVQATLAAFPAGEIGSTVLSSGSNCFKRHLPFAGGRKSSCLAGCFEQELR